MIKYVKGEGKNIAPAKSMLFVLSQQSALEIIIKKNKGITKFKVRTPKYLFTLKVDNQEKADRIMQAIPPSNFVRFEAYIIALSKVTIEKKKKKSA